MNTQEGANPLWLNTTHLIQKATKVLSRGEVLATALIREAIQEGTFGEEDTPRGEVAMEAFLSLMDVRQYLIGADDKARACDMNGAESRLEDAAAASRWAGDLLYTLAESLRADHLLGKNTRRNGYAPFSSVARTSADEAHDMDLTANRLIEGIQRGDFAKDDPIPSPRRRRSGAPEQPEPARAHINGAVAA